MAQGGAEAAAPLNLDTIVAIATPPGEGAIGMVRLSGPKALAIARAFVLLEEPAPKAATLARALDRGKLLDTVVLTWHPAPRSYTGEEMVELAAHGSPYVLRRLVELTVEAGARPAAPGEFTQRAYLNGKLDLAQAEAVCALIRARTASAHRAAAEQLEGGLSTPAVEARNALVELLARLEVAIDHSDDEHPMITTAEAARALAPAASGLNRLLAAARNGRLASEGLRIAIVGAPNAGKSSLLNALLGQDRAIVLDQPGTTRDTLEEACDLGGLLCRLIDTAGLREGKLDPAESLGVERTKKAIDAADLRLVVLDASRLPTPEDRVVLDAVHGKSSIVVFNKSDLNPSPLSGGGCGWGGINLSAVACVHVSALHRTGLDSLAAAIRRAAGLPEAGESETAVSASLRHLALLQEALSELASAGRVLSESRPDFAELSAVHLRAALSPLDAMLGRDAGKDVLSEIFSRFCIGK